MELRRAWLGHIWPGASLDWHKGVRVYFLGDSAESNTLPTND